MLVCYNLDAPKKPTNLTINSDLLSQAKNLNINISSVLESALADKVKQKIQSDWLEENAESIAFYNNHIDTFGVFSNDLRTF
jgi:antitoxin CcdA